MGITCLLKFGRTDEERKRIREVNYAGAWGLVHLLRNGRSREQNAQAFQSFLVALDHGVDAKDAFISAFGEAGAKRVEAEYREQLVRESFDVSVVKYTPPVLDAVSQRAMSVRRVKRGRRSSPDPRCPPRRSPPPARKARGRPCGPRGRPSQRLRSPRRRISPASEGAASPRGFPTP